MFYVKHALVIKLDCNIPNFKASLQKGFKFIHSRLSIMKHQYIYVTYYHGTTPTDHLDLLTEYHLYRIVTEQLNWADACWIQQLRHYGMISLTTLETVIVPGHLRNFWRLIYSNHNMLPNCIYSAQTHNASVHCIVHHSVYTSIIPYLCFNFFTHKLYPIININKIQ